MEGSPAPAGIDPTPVTTYVEWAPAPAGIDPMALIAENDWTPRSVPPHPRG